MTQRIVGSGGYSKSALWLQIQSDVFGQEIQVSGVTEASALGAAYVSVASLGAIDRNRPRLPGMEPTSRVAPNAENHEMFQKVYAD